MDEPLRLMVSTEPAEGTSTAAAFEAFFLEERVELFRALCLITRDRHEAEELTQDAFVRVLERWDRVGGMDDPRSYLYRTAMNALRSRYRRARLAARRAIRISRPADAIADVDDRDVAARALARLPSRQRAAVVLVDLLGYPSKEAARLLGIRASTVRMHTSRAHAALKETMRDD